MCNETTGVNFSPVKSHSTYPIYETVMYITNNLLRMHLTLRKSRFPSSGTPGHFQMTKWMQCTVMLNSYFLYNDMKRTDQTYCIDVFMYMCIQTFEKQLAKPVITVCIVVCHIMDTHMLVKGTPGRTIRTGHWHVTWSLLGRCFMPFCGK